MKLLLNSSNLFKSKADAFLFLVLLAQKYKLQYFTPSGMFYFMLDIINKAKENKD